MESPINISQCLNEQARKIENVASKLKDTQVRECSEDASLASVERLRRSVQSLDAAVEDIESCHR